MAASLRQVLEHTQCMNIQKVYVIVSSDNERSIKILEMVQFKLVPTEAGYSRTMLYGIRPANKHQIVPFFSIWLAIGRHLPPAKTFKLNVYKYSFYPLGTLLH